eukprot:20177-Heterococcus_DN1.PRE.1
MHHYSADTACAISGASAVMIITIEPTFAATRCASSCDGLTYDFILDHPRSSATADKAHASTAGYTGSLFSMSTKHIV